MLESDKCSELLYGLYKFHNIVQHIKFVFIECILTKP